MSHRTDYMGELKGIARWIHNFRHHEATRQVLAFVLVAVVSYWGKPQPVWFWIGVPLIVIGEAIRMWASGHIKKNRELATDGPYAIVRHPLYTGNILTMAGFCFAATTWWAWVFFVVLIWFFYPAAIRYEDYKLHRFFGEQWETWRATTPALVPRRLHFHNEQPWSFNQSLRKNGEPLILLYLAAWLWLLYNHLA